MAMVFLLIFVTTLTGFTYGSDDLQRLTNPSIDCFPNKTMLVTFGSNITKYNVIVTHPEEKSADGVLTKFTHELTAKDQTINIILTELGQYVYVILTDKPKPNNIIGGDGYKEFLVRCKQIEINGTYVTVQQTATETMKPTQLSTVSPTFHLALIITKGVKRSDVTTTKSSVHEFVIGEPYTLWITGPVEYSLYPQKCTAADKAAATPNHYDLVTDGCPKEKSLLGDFTAAKGNVSAQMFGFRFMTSKEVYLMCTIKVCPVKGCGGAEELKKYGVTPSCPATDRKKRSVKRKMAEGLRLRRDSKHTTFFIHEVKTKLHVVDTPSELSASQKLYSFLYFEQYYTMIPEAKAVDIHSEMLLLVSVLFTLTRCYFQV